jgi:hypothetical protein
MNSFSRKKDHAAIPSVKRSITDTQVFLKIGGINNYDK